jgi:hypothetical protein
MDVAPASSAAQCRRLLILRPALELGGVETRLTTLAEALAAAGGRATVLAGGGQLEQRVRSCAELRVVDFSKLSDRRLAQLVSEAADGHDGAVLACEPVLLRAVAPLASRVPVLLGLHGRGDPNRFGFGFLGGRRLPETISRLVATRRVALVATCTVQARAQARQLGLADDVIWVSPNCVPVPPNPLSVSSGVVRSIALTCRLTREKLVNVAAAIELTVAGRDAGRDVTLDVYGGGHAFHIVRAMLRRRLPADAWRMHGPLPSPDAAVQRADVVVGTGRASVEALVSGRRVVPAKTIHHRDGQLGPVVTPETFDEVAAENFSWRTRQPVPAAEVWRQLEDASAQSIRAVCDRARRELTPAAMLTRELAILDTLETSADARATTVLGDIERTVSRRLSGARRLPRPFDLPDRVTANLRSASTARW